MESGDMQTDAFTKFWRCYPKKVAKKDAFKAWNQLTAEQQQMALEALPNHARRWDDPQYIPHAGTWLRGWRFEDELPEDKPQIVQWWKSDQSTLAYGNQKGMRPRPGESMQEYRARLRAA